MWNNTIVLRILTGVVFPAQLSAGFDAHWRDPLELLNFQSATYHKLVSGVRDLADELCGARSMSFCHGLTVSFPHNH